MRHEVVFFLNGQRRRVGGGLAFWTLAEYLRDDRGLVGTKIGCAEGDCGACTVLIGRPEVGAIRYRPATSCILAVCQVDASHVVTVEGLHPADDDGDRLTPIQEAMVAHHGSQCGFCTPGVVVALSGLFETDPDPDDRALAAGLVGNLCRCTGYLPILEAGRAAERGRHRRLADLYPERGLAEDLARLAAEPLRVEAGSGAGRRVFYRPDRAADAVAFRAEHPGAVVLAGGTDIGVWRNRRGFEPPVLLSLAGVAEWDEIRRDGDLVSVGANVTWAGLDEFLAREAPGLPRVTDRFASPQIRNVATLAGNVANGSPIADSVGFLHVVGASVVLAGPRGTRSVDIGDFYTGYRQTVLAADEVIARVEFLLPDPGERIKLYKVSKREELDISTFRAGIRVRASGGRVERAVVSFAGVGPKVLRLPETEAYLEGRPFAEATFREAGRLARAEVEPISDVRGSRDFRLALSENILLKFFYDCVRDQAGEPTHAV
jgi:xanthine dehydrogenase small subunit